MGLLKRNELLEKMELEIVQVPLGNGNFVYVRQMTGRERDQFEASLVKMKESPGGVVTVERATEDFRAKLAVNTLCDEKGVNLLKPEDFSQLSQNISAARLEVIINAAQKLNAITEEDKAALVKNLEGGQSDDSILDSASNLDTPPPDDS